MPIPIVICDDSSFARKQMARALPAGWNVEVTFAANGVEGLETIRAGKADILFLDLTMPVLDGFGVLEAIRKEDLNTMVIVVSGDIQPESHRRVMALGALDFIKKPIDAQTLTSVLESYGILSELTATTSQTESVEFDLFDWCKEITNVAMGRAADQLAQVLKVPVTLSIPEVSMLSGDALCHTLFDNDKVEQRSLVSQGFVGRELTGETMVIFSNGDESKLLQLMHRGKGSVYEGSSAAEMELDLAALLMGALLNGWANQLDIQLSLGHPHTLLSANRELHCASSRGSLSLLAITLDYTLEECDLQCRQLLLFTSDSLSTLNHYAQLALD